MDKKTIIAIFGGMAYIFFLYSFFSKSLIADSKYFYIVVFAVSLIIGLLFIVFWGISKINIANTINPIPHNLSNVYSRINEILRGMPTAEEFMWDYGKTTRIDTRTFDKNKFIGIIGNSNINNRRMLVIYSEQEDAIVRYSGDPSKAQEMDIFDNFKPIHKEPLSIFDRINKKKRHIPTVVVNTASQNQQQEENTEEETTKQ